MLFASPQDYVAHHKRYLEDTVMRANHRVRQRLDQRDATIAEAARAIREINRTHYGDETTGPILRAAPGMPVVRLAV